MRLVCIDIDGTTTIHETERLGLNSRGWSKDSTETAPSVLRMMGKRHLWGTRRRDRHFLSASLPTPSDRAALSTIDQSSAAMLPITRDDLSPSQGTNRGLLNSSPGGQNVPMGKERPPTSVEIARRKRLIDLRKNFNPPMSQSYVAKGMGITTESYKKMERRGRIPSWHLDMLAHTLRCTIEYIQTGEMRRRA